MKPNKAMQTLIHSIKVAMRKYGFNTAADLMNFSFFKPHELKAMLNSWNEYPKSFKIYPDVLTPKIYNEETTLYVRV